MKILIVCLLLPGVSFGQSHQAPKDSVVRIEFNDYLISVLSQPQDSVFKTDSSVTYILKYMNTCHFNHLVDINPADYADSREKICMGKISSLSNSFKLNTWMDQLDTVPSFGYTELGDYSKLKYFSFKKETHLFNLDNSSQTDFISFNNGQYIFVSERRFGPDIRSSLPPGHDVTYFLEIK